MSNVREQKQALKHSPEEYRNGSAENTKARGKDSSMQAT